MITYKLFNSLGQELILKNGNALIPKDSDNTDYQEYLKFLENGGTPLPAENT